MADVKNERLGSRQRDGGVLKPSRSGKARHLGPASFSGAKDIERLGIARQVGPASISPSDGMVRVLGGHSSEGIMDIGAGSYAVI